MCFLVLVTLPFGKTEWPARWEMESALSTSGAQAPSCLKLPSTWAVQSGGPVRGAGQGRGPGCVGVPARLPQVTLSWRTRPARGRGGCRPCCADPSPKQRLRGEAAGRRVLREHLCSFRRQSTEQGGGLCVLALVPTPTVVLSRTSHCLPQFPSQGWCCRVSSLHPGLGVWKMLAIAPAKMW